MEKQDKNIHDMCGDTPLNLQLKWAIGNRDDSVLSQQMFGAVVE